MRRVPVSTWSRRELIGREWLVTNGLGGYASGTLAGPPTRRYHALLVAALPAPLGRLALLAQLDERIRLPSRRVAWLGRAESDVALIDFRLVGGLPVWRYALDDIVIEKRVFMPHEHNSIVVTYRLAAGREGPARAAPDGQRADARGAGRSHRSRRSPSCRRTTTGST